MADKEMKRCPCCKGLGTLKTGKEVSQCVECAGVGKVDTKRTFDMPCINWSTPVGQGAVSRDSMYSVDSGCYQKTALLFD